MPRARFVLSLGLVCLLATALPARAAPIDTTDTTGTIDTTDTIEPIDQGRARPQGATDAPQTANAMVAAWQKEIDAAKARRSHARHLQALGIVMAIAGDAIVAANFEASCPSRSCSAPPPFALGFGLLIVGAPMGIVNGVRAHDADGVVNALIARGPIPIGGLALPVGDHQSVSVAVGQTTAVAYHVKW